MIDALIDLVLYPVRIVDIIQQLVAVPFEIGEIEHALLALEPLCVATGSACNSQSKEPSYVLRSLGRSDVEAQSAIRFSFGEGTTFEEIDTAIELYRKAVEKLRSLAP